MMESRVEQTVDLFKRGYNCAQAIACTYCGLLGADEKVMFRVAEGLGVGMGTGAGTCGALAGACLVAGLKASDGNMDDPKTKAETLKLTAKLSRGFEEKISTTICREIKGRDTGKILRTCPGCVEDAAVLVEKVLFSE